MNHKFIESVMVQMFSIISYLTEYKQSRYTLDNLNNIVLGAVVQPAGCLRVDFVVAADVICLVTASLQLHFNVAD